MKKWLLIMGFLLLLFSAGCSSSADFELNLETAPKYKAETSYPIVIEVLKDGEPAEGVDMTATLEMARMDHGTIEVSFTDSGEGKYEAQLELPMGGEWIANIKGSMGKDEFEEVITFDVKED